MIITRREALRELGALDADNRITDEGRAFLEANRAPLDALLERMNGASGERRHMPRIVRAMANVKLALRMRFSRGGNATGRV